MAGGSEEFLFRFRHLIFTSGLLVVIVDQQNLQKRSLLFALTVADR